MWLILRTSRKHSQQGMASESACSLSTEILQHKLKLLPYKRRRPSSADASPFCLSHWTPLPPLPILYSTAWHSTAQDTTHPRILCTRAPQPHLLSTLSHFNRSLNTHTYSCTTATPPANTARLQQPLRANPHMHHSRMACLLSILLPKLVHTLMRCRHSSCTGLHTLMRCRRSSCTGLHSLTHRRHSSCTGLHTLTRCRHSSWRSSCTSSSTADTGPAHQNCTHSCAAGTAPAFKLHWLKHRRHSPCVPDLHLLMHRRRSSCT